MHEEHSHSNAEVKLIRSKSSLAALIMDRVRDRSLRSIEIRTDDDLGWVAVPNGGFVSPELLHRVDQAAAELRYRFRLPTPRMIS